MENDCKKSQKEKWYLEEREASECNFSKRISSLQKATVPQAGGNIFQKKNYLARWKPLRFEMLLTVKYWRKEQNNGWQVIAKNLKRKNDKWKQGKAAKAISELFSPLQKAPVL